MVEGSVLPPLPKMKKIDAKRIIFTKLIFVNGYRVPLQANGVEALLRDRRYEQGRYVEAQYPVQCTPQPGCALEHPPFDHHTGQKAAIISGSVAVFGLTVYLLIHHANNVRNDLLLNEGAQFQMQLESSLTLDASKVREALLFGMPSN